VLQMQLENRAGELEPVIRPDFPAAFVARWKMRSHSRGVFIFIFQGILSFFMMYCVSCEVQSIGTIC
jgi:hypothetical protein